MKQSEHQLQCQCIKWFDLQHSKYRMNLFAIPNGAKRDPRSGAWYKSEGMRAGVADLCLAVPSKDNRLHGLFIEMKTGKNDQTDAQKEFQKSVLSQDYAYYVVRSVEEFMLKINNYLQ